MPGTIGTSAWTLRRTLYFVRPALRKVMSTLSPTICSVQNSHSGDERRNEQSSDSVVLIPRHSVLNIGTGRFATSRLGTAGHLRGWVCLHMY